MEHKLHLLLLEDDEHLRTALESLLVDEGYSVCTAGDGRQAIAEVAQQPPDILLLDVKLPGPDGLEVLQQLKQQLPELQSLVMTGYASEEDSIRAIRLGVGDYLQKPFSMSDFLTAVDSIARRTYRLKQLKQREEALEEVTRWSLEFLTSSVDLSTPSAGETRRWAGEKAEAAAAALNFSPQAVKTAAPAVLYYLLSREDDTVSKLSNLKKLLSEPALKLAEQIHQAPGEPEEPSLLNLCRFVVSRVEKSDIKVSPKILEAVSQSAESTQQKDISGRSDLAILGLARTLMLSGDREGSLDALKELVADDKPSQTAGQALLMLAELEPDNLKTHLRRLLSWLPKLAPVEAARLQFQAGLLTTQRGLSQGPELLKRAVSTFDTLSLPGESASANLALWSQGSDTEFETHLEVLLAPHRGDLLAGVGSWLLEPLLAHMNSSIAKRAALRIIRESPKALQSAGRRPETASGLLTCLEELGGGPEPVLRRLCAPTLPDDIKSRSRALLSKGEQKPLMRLIFFGSFELHIGDMVLAGKGWGSQKARFLLACLGHRARPTDQEILVEQFWPDSAPGRGLKNLYQALTDIRQAVDPYDDPIARSGQMLQLNPDYPLWSDAEEFEGALEESKKTNDPRVARELMNDALRLYQGPFLQDCPLEWAETQRRDFELKQLQLLERLTECCLNLGHNREVLTLTQQLLSQDKCHQTAHLSTMEAYIALGRPEEAIRQYQRAEVALANEMGLEPSIELFKALQKAKMLM